MSSNPPPATPPTTSSTRRRRSSSAATALAASSPAWIQKLLAPFTTTAALSPTKLAVDQLDEGFFEDTDHADGRSFDLLTAFPIEISLTILSFLPAPDLARLSSVSRAWAVLLSDDLTWRATFEATPGYQLRPSYVASLTPATSPSLSSVPAVAPSTPTRPSSPSQLLSALSISPTRSTPSTQIPTLPTFKTLYAKRLWLARRFGRNNPPGPYDPQTHNVVERELAGHTDSIYAVWFDGRQVITGSRDRSIRVWNVDDGSSIQTIDNAHGASVLSLVFEEVGPGGQKPMGVSGGSDGVVALWERGVEEGKGITKVGVLVGHSQGVLDVAINEHYIVSCSKDTSILVHSRKAPYPLLHRLDLHTGPVNALSLDSHCLASASGDGRLRIWDLETGECKRRLKGHERGLACVGLKGGWVVSGSNDQTIKVWKADTGECVRTLAGHTDLVRSLDFSPSMGLIVSGGYDRKILVWSLETGRLLRTLRSSHTSHVFDLSLDGSKIVSAGHDKKVLVYDFGDPEAGRWFV